MGIAKTSLFILLTALSGTISVAAEIRSSPCPDIVILSPEAITLETTEENLVCGERSLPGWAEVPDNQSRYFLRVFLQERGFHTPEFSEEGNVLMVRTGPATTLEKVVVRDDPESSRLLARLLTGRRLTPKTLDEAEAWLRRRLEENAHPCARVRVVGVVASRTLYVGISPGDPQVFTEPALAQSDDIAPQTLQRFEAFQSGTPFDVRLLELSERRAVASGVVRSTFYSSACQGEGLAITQRVFPGAPKSVSLGIGFNTEELLLGRASWRHSRLGRLGNSVGATLFLSGRTQRLGFNGEWYFYPPDPRISLQPTLTLQQRTEPEYRLLSLTAEAQLVKSYDSPTAEVVLRAGPTYVTERTYGRDSPTRDQYLSLDTRVATTSHLFEYYRNLPRTGYRVALWNSTVLRRFYSDFDASRFGLEGDQFFNYRAFDPPMLVFQARFQLGTTWVPHTGGLRQNLPVRYRHFLGGGRDFRGFARQELPGPGNVALTSASLGFALRYAHIRHQTLQPYVLLDLAQLGQKPMTLDRPWYWAPGVGLIWVSPIGAIRGSLAHGFAANTPPGWQRETHWQFYASLGEEF